jgi:hypothetical protein
MRTAEAGLARGVRAPVRAWRSTIRLPPYSRQVSNGWLEVSYVSAALLEAGGLLIVVVDVVRNRFRAESI